MSDLESRLRSTMHDETIEISARASLADEMVARGTRVRRRRRIAGGVAALAVLAAVVPVWHSIDTSGSRVGPTSPSHSPTTSPPSHRRPVLPQWGSTAVAVKDHTDGSSRVVNLRVGRHATYDRVVVDLTGDITGYQVKYVPQFIQDGSGKPVTLPGDAVLAIRLTSTAAHDDSGNVLIPGGRDRTYAFPAVLGSTRVDYEGTVSFGLGLAHRSDFRVFPLTSPTRLVIDVLH